MLCTRCGVKRAATLQQLLSARHNSSERNIPSRTTNQRLSSVLTNHKLSSLFPLTNHRLSSLFPLTNHRREFSSFQSSSPTPGNEGTPARIPRPIPKTEWAFNPMAIIPIVCFGLGKSLN
eukprot:sb/3476186/